MCLSSDFPFPTHRRLPSSSPSTRTEIVTHKKYFRLPEKRSKERLLHCSERKKRMKKCERRERTTSMTQRWRERRRKRSERTRRFQNKRIELFPSRPAALVVWCLRVEYAEKYIHLRSFASARALPAASQTFRATERNGSRRWREKNASAITRSHLIDEKNVTELLKFDLHVEPNAKGLSIYYYDECSEREHIFSS